jgi:hypothetical protein
VEKVMKLSDSKSKIVTEILTKFQLPAEEISSKNIQVIGIDGPTAAGKTIFAKHLKDEFEN